jgi:outer membrane protein OmpA-like peptidoglycan-associated protein
MFRYTSLLMTLAALSLAATSQAEPLILNQDTDLCDLFEALNGPEKVPAHCARAHQADCQGPQCKGIKPVPAPQWDRAMLPDINFEYASHALSEEAQRELDKVAAVMSDPNYSVGQKYRIEGNTDRKGSAAYNLRLSKSRAEAVKQYLVQRGVKGEQLMAIGNGYRNLLDPYHPYDAINRRVEFVNMAKRSL